MEPTLSLSEIITYDEVFKKLVSKKRQTSLLLGNGFSMAFDPKIFSYNALSDFVTDSSDPLLSKLFKAINTSNFEQIMQHLSALVRVLEAFDPKSHLINDINDANVRLKQSLIDAIEALHPEHVFKIPQEKSLSCAKFLKTFIESGGNIFTTNYDLLLYWVLMRNPELESVDGFGRDLENEDEVSQGEDQVWSELRWGKHKSNQRIFYVHGALPLFDDGIEIVKEVYNSDAFLLQNIRKRINKGDYPVFVTAGNGSEKLQHIVHNRYLTYCYESLSRISGSLVTFGFNFGDFDLHIIEAINKASHKSRCFDDKLYSIYIGIYNQSDKDRISSILSKFRCKVYLYDAKTVNIWSHQ